VILRDSVVRFFNNLITEALRYGTLFHKEALCHAFVPTFTGRDAR